MTKKPYRLGAIAFVINEKNQLLIVQLNSYGENEWNMPGGGREQGEGATNNAMRELREELDIKESELQLVGVSNNPLQYDFPPEMEQKGEPIALNYAGQRKDQVVFKANIKRELEVNTGEIRSYMWCHVSKLKNYLIFPKQYEGTVTVLEEFNLF